LDAVDGLADAGGVGAVRAAVERAVGLDAVADDLAGAVRAHVGASAWIAHSKLSNTCVSPLTTTCIVLS
jgi:hypothetical protein